MTATGRCSSTAAGYRLGARQVIPARSRLTHPHQPALLSCTGDGSPAASRDSELQSSGEDPGCFLVVLRFTFSSNSLDANRDRLEYHLAMIDSCRLTADDRFIPDRD